MQSENIDMIVIKTREEIELMRESALVVSKTLGMLAKEVKAGVTTQQLDTLAEDFIRSQGAIPGFLGLYDCPSTLLCSVNEAVVHGLPTNIPLKEGDIISIDCGCGPEVNHLVKSFDHSISVACNFTQNGAKLWLVFSDVEEGSHRVTDPG